jgi:WD40 repeat protein
MILDFAWSEKELRVGAVFQDYTVSFWDMMDKFSFEKCLQTTKYMDLLQTRVWYVDSGAWLTTDKSNGFYEWNIETETCIKWPVRHEGQIITLINLNRNRIASSALDRCIIIWDLTIRNSISVLVLSDVSAHTMVYSSDFSLLLSAGFERTVLVWKLEGNRECNLLNKLEGHTHTISALAAVKTTPIAITSDDAGFIKSWDLRTFKCLQTLNMDRMEINRILAVPNLNTFIAVGNRLYWFEYSSMSNMNANGVNVRYI